MSQILNSPIKSIVCLAERLPISIKNGLTILISIIFIRNFLEALIESRHTTLSLQYDDITDTIHVIFSWLVVYIATTLIVSIITSRPQVWVNRLVLRCFPIILIPPIFDLLIGFTGRVQYQYNFSEFFSSFLGLFNPLVKVSYVTPGVRVEILVAVLVISSYSFLLKRRFEINPYIVFIQSCALAICIYILPFILGFLPAVLIQFFGLIYSPANSAINISKALSFISWYLPILLVALPLWIWRSANLVYKEGYVYSINAKLQNIINYSKAEFNPWVVGIGMIITNVAFILYLDKQSISLTYYYDFFGVIWLNLSILILLQGLSLMMLHKNTQSEFAVAIAVLACVMLSLINPYLSYISLTILMLGYLFSSLSMRVKNIRFIIGVFESLGLILIAILGQTSAMGNNADKAYAHINLYLLIIAGILPIIIRITLKKH